MEISFLHLVHLAKDLRARQKAYFARRQPTDLVRAKQAEAEMDEWLEAYEKHLGPDLFEAVEENKKI